MKHFFLLTTILTLKIVTVYGQCTDQVLHINGSMYVNGVLTTVSKTGKVDSSTIYCNNTLPYFVGYNNSSFNGNGAYTFNFSPAVDSVTLNFSGISYRPPTDAYELVKLYVNGLHYSIPTIGAPNGCDTMAVLTSTGDIMGCLDCGVSGWNGTTIAGPISSLSVVDSVIYGVPSGSLFSLFICYGLINHVDQNEIKTTYQLFPNPFSNETNLLTDKMLKNATLIVYNSFGKEVKEVKNISGQKITLHRDNLQNGLYYIQLKEDGIIIINDKLIITE